MSLGRTCRLERCSTRKDRPIDSLFVLPSPGFNRNVFFLSQTRVTVPGRNTYRVNKKSCKNKDSTHYTKTNSTLLHMNKGLENPYCKT